MKEKASPVGRVHADHEEFAMGEVDDVHDAEDDREPEGHQGKKKAHQDSLEDGIENDHTEPRFKF